MATPGISRSGSARGQQVRLEIQYLDQGGQAADTAGLPTIEISSPGALPADPYLIIVPATSTGVTKVDTGLYAYDYTIPAAATYGVWKDHWIGSVLNSTVDVYFSFVVSTQISPVATLVKTLDPNLSVTAEANVYDLLNLVKARVGSTGLRRKRDAYGKYLLDAQGNYITEQCNIFTDSDLYLLLKAALAEFNSIPHFTNYTFDNTQFVQTFQHELTEGAVILAFAKQGLFEKGKEFQITDDGVSYQPPALSDYIKSYLSDLMTKYQERLKFIKCNMKPGPIGLGTVYSWASGGAAPAYMRLRHLRARQII